MASGVDGSIVIDTRIREGGLNQGVKKISTALQGMLQKITAGLQTAAAAAAGMVGTFNLIGLALIMIAVKAWKFFEKLTNDLAESANLTGFYKAQVEGLKAAYDGLHGAAAALGVSLLNALGPALKFIINLMVQLINWASMFIAALSGQKTVMQYVSGSAEKASKGAAKAAKAAKGALAAFDEINVLQMADQESAGGGGGGGGFTMKEVPIDAGILETGTKIRQWFIDAWNWIAEKAVIAWEWIKVAFQDGADWLAVNVVGPLTQWFIGAWEWIRQAAADAWEFIITILIPRVMGFFQSFVDWYIALWQGVHDWLNQAVQDFVKWYIGLWQGVQSWFVGFAAWYTGLWQSVQDGLKAAFQAFVTWYTGLWQGVHDWFTKTTNAAWNGIKAIWAAVGSWFTVNVTEPIKNAFRVVLDWIQEKWETVFGGVKNFTKNAVNTIITFINTLIRGLANGLNTIINALNSLKIDIPEWVPLWGGKKWSMNIKTVPAPQIPLLATGAVIPPNAPFAAILGDQKNGRNIELPENLLRQIMREEGGGDMTANFTIQLDNEVLYKGMKRAERRQGKSLAVGGA